VGATKVVFAYHTDDPTSEKDIKLHTFKGARTILLLNSLDKRDINETGWTEFTLTGKNVRNSVSLLHLEDVSAYSGFACSRVVAIYLLQCDVRQTIFFGGILTNSTEFS